jgi:hypothetical protein
LNIARGKRDEAIVVSRILAAGVLLLNGGRIAMNKTLAAHYYQVSVDERHRHASSNYVVSLDDSN